MKDCADLAGEFAHVASRPAKIIREHPVRIDELMTKAHFASLIEHMLNANPVSHFLVAWRDKDGVARFAKAKPHKNAGVHAGWTYDTIVGKAKRETSMGLYPKNTNNESTWAALDFDAHDESQRDVAKERAIRAFTSLLEYRDRYLLLTDSGRGYHVFIFAGQPRSITEWITLLKETVATVSTPIQDGVCEIFPGENSYGQEVGRGIRVPGSINPATGEAEKIMADTIQPLLDQLAKDEAAAKKANRERNSSSPRKLSLVKETNSYYCTDGRGFFAASTHRLIEQLVAKYPIPRTGTRNSVLAKLVGELFHKFGHAVSEQIVSRHYQTHSGNVRTGLDEHLREFRQAWKSFRKKELTRLTQFERERFDKLQTEPQREAFFLCRSFAKLTSGEFPLSQASLADRVGLTPPGAGYVIDRLIEVGANKKTAETRPHSRCAHYRWIRSDQTGVEREAVNTREQT